METTAIVIDAPGQAAARRVLLSDPGPADLVVAVAWSGISAGTERLLWSGTMPPFPGMGYPLVPGYESAGTVVEAGGQSGWSVGETVFVPGASCFSDVRCLFGGAARHLVVPQARAVRVPEALGEQATLLALAATAHHALAGGAPPDLVVGHGVLGRLVARLAVALGHAPPRVVERDAARRTGARGYEVIDPDAAASLPPARVILDASGDAAVLDGLVPRLARGGEIVLAGFYPGDVRFRFAPAFSREMRLRIAAEWEPHDLESVRWLVERGTLPLDGLITHRAEAHDAAAAYETAFTDAHCLKMVLDWRHAA